MTRKLKWIIDGERKMHCAGCTSTVEYALSQMSGVKSSTADHRSQTIVVEIDDDVEPDVIAETIAGLGYKARVLNSA
ncbi:MAG: heavy metal-associated domain-containing protein [Anaerolineales bacterium]